MAITWLRTEEEQSARVKTYPKIGGGARRKDFGYVGQSLTLTGVGSGETDRDTARGYVSDRRERTFRVPWGSGQTERVRVLVKSGQLKPLGAGWFEVRLQCEVVE